MHLGNKLKWVGMRYPSPNNDRHIATIILILSSGKIVESRQCVVTFYYDESLGFIIEILSVMPDNNYSELHTSRGACNIAKDQQYAWI